MISVYYLELANYINDQHVLHVDLNFIRQALLYNLFPPMKIY
jgi:hypothetical protein